MVIHEGLRIAVVDGSWLRLDQDFDGCRLTAIAGNEVRFACHDGDAVLRVNAFEDVRQR